jgi:1-acyl-sn-glycerol-3-phosphate acyltransferase
VSYFLRILIAIDQLFNVLICNGEPDETMSSAAYRMHAGGRFWGFLMHVINAIFFDKNHCSDAYLAERQRAQLAPEFRA